MKLRGALLGCGQVSHHQLKAWAQIEGVEIVAIYNRTKSRAEERAREYGIPLDHVYDDYLELLEKEDLDFVDIATIPQVHKPQVEAAANVGIPILCQKPLATSLEEALAMKSICEKANVLFSVNENWRWRSWYRKLKEILDNNDIGPLRYVNVMKHRSATLPGLDGSPPPLAGEPSLLEFERLIIYDWGIHLIDLLRYLFGEISDIFARVDQVSHYFKGEDRAHLSLKIGGMMGFVDVSWASIIPQPDTVNVDVSPENIQIEGDNGTIEIFEEKNLIRVITKQGITEVSAYEGTPMEEYIGSYAAAQRHFVECLKTGKLPETEVNDNIKTLLVTFAAYESAANNKVVTLDYDRQTFK
jgi:predicted dehydrogenase